MKSKDLIFLENSAASSVARGLRLQIWTTSAVAFMSILLNVGCIYAILYVFPVKQFVWTSDARAVCNAITLDQPSVSDARVRNMAAEAAMQLNSYDYLNWRRQIQSAMNSFLTTRAQTAYSAALNESNTIKRVEDGFYTVTALLGNKPPRISSQGLDNGRYYWQVEVPLIVFYKTPQVSKPESRVLVMKIVRVEPSFINPNGIAIDGVVSAQEVTG